MKQTALLIALLVYGIFACAQPTPVQVRILQNHHYIGQNEELKEGINYFAITSRRQYEKFFGPTNRPDTPQFSKEIMLVMLMPKSKKESRLVFKKMDVKAGDFIEVYCEMKTNLGKATYEAYPIAACAIPRYDNIKRLVFYNEKNMQRLASLTIKN